MTARPPFLAALLILGVLAALWPRARVQPFGVYDQPFYLGIAYDLVEHGRFTDGFMFAGGDATTARPAGMRFTPLYPAMLAAAARLDPSMRRDMDCLVRNGLPAAGCGHHAGPVRGLQFGMLAACYWLIWWSARALGGSSRCGWLALGLALPTAPLLLLSVNYLMTETTSLFLCLLAQALALRAVLPAGRPVPRERTAWLAASGASLGLAALTRPSLLPLGLAAILGGLCLYARPRRRPQAGPRPWRQAAPLGGFCAGFVVVLLPWLLRNRLVLHRAGLTFGYASHTLVQRLSFDRMGWRELMLSVPCWLPDGNGIGRALAGPHACDRFGWDDPAGYYLQGIGPMLDATLAQAGGWEHHMRFLLHRYLLAEPLSQLGWHALVTLPLALRGLAIDHWWGMMLAPPCLAMTLRALWRRRPTDLRLLLLCAPGWFMLGLNAAVAVDQPRYNLMLLMPFSVCAAIAVERRLRSTDCGAA